MNRRGAQARLLAAILLASGLAVGSCGCGPVPLQRLGAYVCVPCTDLAAPAADAPSAATLAGADWLYQLQGAASGDITDTAFDIVVMDYSRDGSEEGATARRRWRTSGPAAPLGRSWPT